MSQSIRKLIGMIALVMLVIVYAIIATAIATAQLAESSNLVHLTYFLFTGLFWIVPAMFIIKWMLKPVGKTELD